MIFMNGCIWKIKRRSIKVEDKRNRMKRVCRILLTSEEKGVTKGERGLTEMGRRA